MKNSSVIFKLLLILIITFTVFSCSEDSKVEQTNTKSNSQSSVSMRSPELDKIKQEYLTILKSESYIIYSSSVVDFSNKFSPDAISTNRDKLELMNWISNNLTKTSFTNVNEASAEFDNISNNYGKVINENKDFFSKLNLLESEDLKEVIALSINNSFERVLASGPCEFGCINDAVSCSNAVNAQYQQAMDLANWYAQWGSVLQSLSISAMAIVNQHIGQHNCATSFNSCIAGCPK